MAARDPFENCSGFDWDDNNAYKNQEKHGVTPEDAERLVVRSDVRHSKKEKRHFALGQTAAGRLLFVSFTTRGELIRVISARDMNRKESRLFDRYEEEYS